MALVTEIESVIVYDIDLSSLKKAVEKTESELKKLQSGIKLQIDKIDSSEVKRLTDQINQEKSTIKPTVDIDLSAERAKFSQIQALARDTGVKIDQELKSKLEIDVAQATLVLKQIRQEIKNTTDKETLIRLSVEARGVQSALTEAKRGLNNLQNTGESTLSRLQSKFDQVKGAIGGAFEGLKGGLLQFAGTIGLATGISQVASSIVTLGSNLQQAQISFTTLLGSAEKANKLLSDLSAFAANTPFELVGIRDQAKLLLAMGVESQNLIPTLKILGDVSAGLSVPLERLALAYGQVLAKGRLQGGELKQFTEAGVPIIAELAKNLGVAQSEINGLVESGQISAVEVTKAFQTMTSEGGKFANLMEAQSKTLGGLRSNLVDTITQLGESIGSKLIPQFSSVVSSIIDITNQYGSAIGGVVSQFTSTVGLVISETFSYISSLVGVIVNTVNTLIDAFNSGQKSSLTFGQVILGVFSAISIGIDTIFTLQKGLLRQSLSSISFAFSAVFVGLGKLINGATSQIDKFTGFINKNFGTSIGQIGQIFSDASFGATLDVFAQETKNNLAKSGEEFTALSGRIQQAQASIQNLGKESKKLDTGQIDLSKITDTKKAGKGGGGGGGGGGSKKEVDEQKKALEEQKKLINDLADQQILGLSRTQKEKEKNAIKILDIDKKRNTEIENLSKKETEIAVASSKEIQKQLEETTKKRDKLAEDEKKIVEDLAKFTTDTATKSYDELQKKIDETGKKIQDYNDKIKSLQSDLTALGASTSTDLAGRVVEITNALKQEDIKAEDKIALEKELALAKANTTEEDIKRAELLAGETETDKILREAEERKIALQAQIDEQTRLRDEQLAIQTDLTSQKEALEKRFSDIALTEIARREAAELESLNKIISKYKELQIAKAGLTGATTTSTGATNNSTATNTINNNINVQAEVSNDIDIDSLSRRLASEITRGSKGIL